MSTVQDVFDIAVRLMDAQNESTGSTNTADTKEYRLRTPSLLNSILDRAYPASDTCPAASGGRRPVCPKVETMEDETGLDEYLSTGVLPFGLAGLLLSEENPTLANFFWQTFLEQLDEALFNRQSAELEAMFLATVDQLSRLSPYFPRMAAK